MNSQFVQRLVLGIDGGGTKTAALLGAIDHADDLRIIGRGFSGSGNPQASGFDRAMQHVQASINDAFENAGIEAQSVYSACISLAGIGRDKEKSQVLNWAMTESVANDLRIATDAEILFAAANTNATFTNLQIALIAGTGSIAWGRSQDLETYRCGGWGYLLGDEGSAYSIAIQALQLACRCADGRANDPTVLSAILEATECTDPQQLIPWTYGPLASRERTASIAETVFQLADQNAACRSIVHEGARQLANMIVSITSKAGSSSYSLALAGGVLCNRPDYIKHLEAELSARDCSPRSVELIREPALGALRLAAEA